MHEKVILDTRTYTIDEIYDRYFHKKLVFFDNKYNLQYDRKRIVREVINALVQGIPFPPVYASELQTGELLVLDKNNKLYYLLKTMEEGDPEYREDILDILYESIVIYVIEYMNPRYVHMRVGAFVEEWSVTQEQAVRNILYEREYRYIFKGELSFYRWSKSLVDQYNFLYFSLIQFIVDGKIQGIVYEYADKFELLEETYNIILNIPGGKIERISSYYTEINDDIRAHRRNVIKLSTYARPNDRVKYIGFAGAWMRLMGSNNFDMLCQDRRVITAIRNCDWSYRSIVETIDIIRGVY
ncbi:hypothetical protein DXA90_05285 [Clostridiaceae bacterium OF09-1]|nr:hypothetical protein DXA90_05285 [Clostridiaceae bacterium OF09-1]